MIQLIYICCNDRSAIKFVNEETNDRKNWNLITKEFAIITKKFLSTFFISSRKFHSIIKFDCPNEYDVVTLPRLIILIVNIRIVIL